ncbi:Deoxyuridine 5'-triphosphate nucleotidohydrolase [compost metagenome]
MDLKVKLLSEDAVLPTRGTDQSAGLDLYATEDFTVPATQTIGMAAQIGRYIVDTKIAVAIPKGMVGTVKPRSGLGIVRGVDAFEGTIDSDYRGPIKVLLYNTNPFPVDIKKGDRIAQLVVTKVEMLKPVSVASLDTTARGEGGLGHTGR